MKNTTKTMLALLALGASALIASAQDAGGPPDGNRPPPPLGPEGGPPGMNGRRPPPPGPLMQALDVNHDGIIDANEIANASAALKKLDKNGDGKLTPDELRPQRPPDGAEGPDANQMGNDWRPPPRSPLMDALDANHDGIIDADEIANAPAALKKLDKNGDGKLTPDELRPKRMQGRGPGPGGPPGEDGWPPPQRPPDGN